MPLRLVLLVLTALAVLALSTATMAQDFQAPPELEEFWARWNEAAERNSDDDLDKVVRRYNDDSRMMLNTMIDDVCRVENTELHFQIRMLAWSLDRVERTERYISRVRAVLDMDMRKRAQRVIATGRYSDGLDQLDEARTKRSDAAWDKATKTLRDAEVVFVEIGDDEFRILTLLSIAQLEGERRRFWDQAQVLKQVLELAQAMPYDDGDVQYARDGLLVVAEQGIDADGPRPEGGGAPAESDGQAQGGTGLSSFADGSEWQEFQLAFTPARKAITKVSLPCLYPPDQFQLWQQTYVIDAGPGEFDFMRGGRFKPKGTTWTLSRDGIETFQIDTNGDGEPDVSFPASSSPQRIEVPVGDGTWPLMVCAIGQREQMFDFLFNYAPTADGARLRFWIASWWEGEVLGQNWKVYDTNIDGTYGVAWENFDDLITDYSDDEHVTFFEPDSVLIGKAKKGVPLSRIMAVGPDFYRVESEPAKGTVRVRKLNMSTGQLLLDYDIKVAPDYLVVREVGELESVYFDVMPARRNKPVTLPVGTYQICLGATSKGGKTSMDQVRVYTGSSQPFTISADETTTLELGAPYKLTFRSKVDIDEVVVDTRTLRCFGRGGEEYAMFFDDPLQPELAARTSDGKKLGKPSKMARVSVGEWERNTGADNILWFPLEQRFTPAPGKTLEFQMTQKSHALLGGPFESEWIR